MAKFEKMRINLARLESAPLADQGGGAGPKRGRSDHLVAAFSETRTFLHARTQRRLSYEPIKAPAGYVGGIFKRERPVELHDESLEPYNAENFESALVIVSVDSQQIAWVEINQRLGSSKLMLSSFLDHLLQKSEINDWRAHIEYFDNEAVYWNVIRERRAEIAKIVFTFVPPNALGAIDKVHAFVKEVQGEANPDSQQHVYRAEPGKMKPDTPLLTASAEIALSGAGEAEVRDGSNRILYSSARSRVISEVPDDELPTPVHPAFMGRLASRLFGQ
nr:hypothetical protein [Polymorphobacter sp.]